MSRVRTAQQLHIITLIQTLDEHWRSFVLINNPKPTLKAALLYDGRKSAQGAHRFMALEGKKSYACIISSVAFETRAISADSGPLIDLPGRNIRPRKRSREDFRGDAIMKGLDTTQRNQRQKEKSPHDNKHLQFTSARPRTRYAVRYAVCSRG